MPAVIKKITFTILCLVYISSLKAQDNSNYFYTSLKIPFLDYIASAIANAKPDPEKTTDGIIFNAGYAINLIPDFYLETGIDYHLGNRLKEKYYADVKLSKLNSMLETQNSAFALQLRPTYKTSIDADDKTFLSIGLGLNIQKLYSNGYYEVYGENNAVENSYTDKVNSDIFPSLQPKLGISFTTNRAIEYLFGLTYSYTNWNRTGKHFHFNNLVPAVSAHKTSNLFFSAGFTF